MSLSKFKKKILLSNGSIPKLLHSHAGLNICSFILPSFAIAKATHRKKLAKEIEVALMLSVCYICNAIVINNNHVVSLVG